MEIYCDGIIGNLPIKLKILSTPEERALGYQHQKTSPNPGEGLLFLFDNPSEQTFHMRNVGFDLDLLGFDDTGKLICKIPMLSDSRNLYKTPPVKFVVEVPRDWAKCLKPGGCNLRVRRVV